MSLSVLLMFLQKLQLFSKLGALNHFRSNGSLIKALGDLTQTTSYRPHIFYYLQDVSIDAPFDLAKDV
jgi:hypothetical protein